jgi:Mg/Co/Ni transporter MgtE
MDYTLLNTASTTALTANVISAFGQNIDAVGVIVALAVAIPLVFVVAHYIKGLFSTRARR